MSFKNPVYKSIGSAILWSRISLILKHGIFWYWNLFFKLFFVQRLAILNYGEDPGQTSKGTVPTLMWGCPEKTEQHSRDSNPPSLCVGSEYLSLLGHAAGLLPHSIKSNWILISGIVRHGIFETGFLSVAFQTWDFEGFFFPLVPLSWSWDGWSCQESCPLWTWP